MSTFITYENRRNPRVTIHAGECSQICKRGGHHAYEQGSYHEHDTFSGAEVFARRTGLP